MADTSASSYGGGNHGLCSCPVFFGAGAFVIEAPAADDEVAESFDALALAEDGAVEGGVIVVNGHGPRAGVPVEAAGGEHSGQEPPLAKQLPHFRVRRSAERPQSGQVGSVELSSKHQDPSLLHLHKPLSHFQKEEHRHSPGLESYYLM